MHLLTCQSKRPYAIICDHIVQVNVSDDGAPGSSSNSLASASCRTTYWYLHRRSLSYTAGTMRTFSLLPLVVLFVGFEAALRLGVVVLIEAKQQCRLQLNNNQALLHTSPIIGTSTSTAGHPPTSTSSGSSTTLPSPTVTPFNYGTEPIRGVNLYVSILFLARS